MIELVALFLLFVGMVISRFTKNIKNKTNLLKKYEFAINSSENYPEIIFDLYTVDFENTNIDKESDKYIGNLNPVYKYRINMYENEESRENVIAENVYYGDLPFMTNLHTSFGGD